jgi:hypothetical protein
MTTAADLEQRVNDEMTDAELDASIAESLKRIRTPKTRHLTGKEIVEQGLKDGTIGSRMDITDGIEYARKMRERSNRRERVYSDGHVGHCDSGGSAEEVPAVPRLDRTGE